MFVVAALLATGASGRVVRLAAAQSVVSAAQARAIEGDVVQAETGVPLSGATVVLLPAASGALVAAPGQGSAFLAVARRVVTGTTGRYHFPDAAPGTYILRVYRLGYRPATVEVELRGEGGAAGGSVPAGNAPGTGAARVSVGLTVVPIRLRPVAVDGEATEPYARRARTVREVADARTAALRVRQARYLSTDAREVTHADVEEAVTLGETDLFRALQRLPGVATQGDASAALWTRGARWDQTRVTFDGLPLFNPLHTGGLFSGVDSDAIGAAFLLPGVRPAAVGDGSAAVVDLRSRAGGGTGALRGAGELSLISGRATLDQTVAGGRGAWMVSARRSYLDLLASQLVADSAGGFPYHLGEITGRADWHFGGGQTLEVSALRSRDAAGDGKARSAGSVDPAVWGNTLARATLTGPARLSPLGTVAMRTTLGVSAYSATVGAAIIDQVAYVDVLPPVRARLTYTTLTGEITPVRDAADTADDCASGAPAPWTAGYALVAQRTAVGGPLASIYTGDLIDVASADRRGTLPMLALWGERRLTPRAGLTIAAGARVEAGAPTRGDGPVRVAPRVTARYVLGDGATAVSAGVGRHYQYLQGLPETEINALNPAAAVLHTVPLWLAADRETPALRTDLVTAGLERWTGAGWDWTVNAYLRHSTGLVFGSEGPGAAVGRPLFVVGGETGRGVELGVRRVVGRWTGGANYALGAATSSAYGLRFPSREDRRHVFNATAGVRLGAGGRLGASFTALSGAPYTRMTSGFARIDSASGALRWTTPPTFGAPDAERLPAFSRLDLLAEWTWRVRRVRLGGYLQVVNATTRTNPLGVTSTVAVDASGPTPLFGAGLPSAVPGGFITFPLVGFRASF